MKACKKGATSTQKLYKINILIDQRSDQWGAQSNIESITRTV